MPGPDIGRLRLVPSAGGVGLTLKVVPNASRTRVLGVWDVALRVAVAAPAEGGKANDAVIALLADALRVRKADVSIVSGRSKPLKQVTISGLAIEAVRERIAARLGSASE
ncbi:MAG: hypothetical protein CHACPFDD_02520 [Phycisphaerae bacterium]|nr:hypothetical protein [Phycisphaerae bacterium]